MNKLTLTTLLVAGMFGLSACGGGSGGGSVTTAPSPVEQPADNQTEEIVDETPEEIIEDPVVEDPIVEDPVVEDPVVEDPVVEDPVVEDPVVEDPVVPEIIDPSITFDDGTEITDEGTGTAATEQELADRWAEKSNEFGDVSVDDMFTNFTHVNQVGNLLASDTEIDSILAASYAAYAVKEALATYGYNWTVGDVLTNMTSGAYNSYVTEFNVYNVSWNVWLDTVSKIDDFGTQNMYDALNVTGLADAHGDGWIGNDTTIAIHDSGSHGIQVATIAQIVAPGANVHIGGNGVWSTMDLPSSADIVNHSYGSSNLSASIKTVYANHVKAVEDFYGNHGALHVWAAPNVGNCSGDQNTVTASTCDTVGVVFQDDSYGIDQDLHIFVGSYGNGTVGGTGHNYDSIAIGSGLAEHSLVADGNGIFGGEGTSYAAPKVAGAAALVQHKFDNINAEQTKQILLDTADDSFSGYDVNKHGQGMLDVGAALSPVGALN